MRKTTKSIRAIIVCLLMVTLVSTGLGFNASALDLQKVTCSAQIASQLINNTTEDKNPIGIAHGFLIDESGNLVNVYWVFLTGTKTGSKNAIGVKEDFLAGTNLKNDYLVAVKAVIQANIPTGSNIVLSGHSLGGMVAQQISGDTQIKADYNILNTVTFGAPSVNSAGKREGTLKRLGYKLDPVPYLSLETVIAPKLQFGELQKVSGGNYSFGDKAHNYSYLDATVFKDYDVLGFKGGTASFTYNLDGVNTYAAPIL